MGMLLIRQIGILALALAMLFFGTQISFAQNAGTDSAPGETLVDDVRAAQNYCIQMRSAFYRAKARLPRTFSNRYGFANSGCMQGDLGKLKEMVNNVCEPLMFKTKGRFQNISCGSQPVGPDSGNIDGKLVGALAKVDGGLKKTKCNIQLWTAGAADGKQDVQQRQLDITKSYIQPIMQQEVRKGLADSAKYLEKIKENMQIMSDEIDRLARGKGCQLTSLRGGSLKSAGEKIKQDHARYCGKGIAKSDVAYRTLCVSSQFKKIQTHLENSIRDQKQMAAMTAKLEERLQRQVCADPTGCAGPTVPGKDGAPAAVAGTEGEKPGKDPVKALTKKADRKEGIHIALARQNREYIEEEKKRILEKEDARAVKPKKDASLIENIAREEIAASPEQYVTSTTGKKKENEPAFFGSSFDRITEKADAVRKSLCDTSGCKSRMDKLISEVRSIKKANVLSGSEYVGGDYLGNDLTREQANNLRITEKETAAYRAHLVSQNEKLKEAKTLLSKVPTGSKRVISQVTELRNSINNEIARNDRLINSDDKDYVAQAIRKQALFQSVMADGGMAKTSKSFRTFRNGVGEIQANSFAAKSDLAKLGVAKEFNAFFGPEDRYYGIRLFKSVPILGQYLSPQAETELTKMRANMANANRRLEADCGYLIQSGCGSLASSIDSAILNLDTAIATMSLPAKRDTRFGGISLLRSGGSNVASRGAAAK